MHAYTEPGNYDVTLTLTTSQGVVTTTVADYIQVAPVVAFTSDVSSGAAPLSVQFTDATDPGSLTITGYSWDFGDGTATSTDQNPFHTYTTGGSFDVSLTVTTAQGNRTFVDQDAIVVTPIIKILASVVDGKGGENGAVSFLDATDVGDATVLGRRWSFGDGSESSEEANPVHVYRAPGTYDVGLDLLTTLGSLSGTVESLVEVPPVPTFTVDQSEGIAPLTLSFTDTTEMGTLSLLGRTWNYGDGTSDSTGAHTYQGPGTYEVTLQIATELGSARSNPTTIKVGINPLAAWFDGRENETGHAWIPVSGGYMLVGTASTGEENGLDVVLVATDGEAQALPGWPRYIGGAGDQQGFSLAATRDGGYVIAGETIPEGGQDANAMLLKVDGDGQLLWNREFGGPGDDRANAVIELRSGRLVIAGASSSPGSNGGFDALVVNTDAAGENALLTWHGAPQDEEAVAVEERSDGILLVSVESGGKTEGLGYQLRLNPDLSVP
ncbi:MAG: PKD domain-containing protein [Candidatus Hydrogenedentes bacterium]|nr:PKD domain-containing protein [Candidatus Hydrogenedentota bacterium]